MTEETRENVNNWFRKLPIATIITVILAIAGYTLNEINKGKKEAALTQQILDRLDTHTDQLKRNQEDIKETQQNIKQLMQNLLDENRKKHQ